MTTFRPSFMKSNFKKHETDLLFEQERAQFPATSQEQKYEQIRVILKYRDYKLKVPKGLILTKNEKSFLFEGIIIMEWDCDDYHNWQVESSRIKIISKDLFRQMRDFYREVSISSKSNISLGDLELLRDSLVKIYDEATDPFGDFGNVKEEGKQVRACPVKSCLGFVAEEICPVCQITSCIECEEIKENEAHICDPRIRANVKTIHRETKPCPGCHIPIFRISGCFMMYCTRCRTGFDWETGGILSMNGWFHNPERDVQRAREDPNVENPCEVSKEIQSHRVYQQYSHIPAMIERRRLLTAAGNLDLRILHLNSLLSKEEFCEAIYQRWKTNSLYQVEVSILQGLRSRLLESFMKTRKVKETIYGMIYKDANDAFRRIAFQTSQPGINISLKDGFVEEKTFLTVQKIPQQIQEILYNEWFFK